MKKAAFIAEQRDGTLLQWTISRPERLHALGPTIGRELLDKLNQLHRDLRNQHQIRLLTITTAPTPQKVWIAGGDLKELAREYQKKTDGARYAKLLTTVCRKIETLPIPVAMLLDGQVIGGATELALAGDFRVATPDTTFYFKQTAIGLATAFGGAQRLLRHVGLSTASQWLLLNAKVDVDQAKKHGIIHEVAANRKELLTVAKNWAVQLAELPFPAIATQKQMLQLGFNRQQATTETQLFGSLWLNPFHKQVLRSFHDSTT